jgi:Methylamine utilisation protein MauE
VATVLQAFLLVVLASAGAMKLAGHDRFLRTLTALPWLPLPAARVGARAVPLAELGVAAVLGASPRVGAVAAMAALALFTGVILREIGAGRRFRCGCFGGTDSQVVGAVTLARNAALVAAAAGVLALPRSHEPGAILTGLGIGLLFLLVEIGTDTLGVPRGR